MLPNWLSDTSNLQSGHFMFMYKSKCFAENTENEVFLKKSQFEPNFDFLRGDATGSSLRWDGARPGDHSF